MTTEHRTVGWANLMDNLAERRTKFGTWAWITGLVTLVIPTGELPLTSGAMLITGLACAWCTWEWYAARKQYMRLLVDQVERERAAGLKRLRIPLDLPKGEDLTWANVEQLLDADPRTRHLVRRNNNGA